MLALKEGLELKKGTDILVKLHKCESLIFEKQGVENIKIL